MKAGKKIVAIMPIKMNNERLPGKNIMLLGNKPLMHYQLDMITKIDGVDSIYVYCSSKEVEKYVSKPVLFLRRDTKLDLPTANFTEIFGAFMDEVYADIYIYVHATAPFITCKTTTDCLEAVLSGEYDSAFCAVKIQDFLWKNNQPLNFCADKLPRSQDIEPIWRETSGVYVFTREVFETTHRRIGFKPYINNLSFKEAIDINTPEDFRLAEIFAKED